MKIIVIGANGTIGKSIVNELSSRHEIIKVGKSSGDFQVDITDINSVRALFEKVGKVDAIVSAAGNVHFGPLSDITPEQYGIGLQDKLMGQVNLALVGQHFLNDGGSITLTSGILTRNPIRYGSSASMVNGALEAFAVAAAIELPRGIRINVVSPNVLQESMDAYGPYFRGFEAVPAARVALAFSRSVEGAQTGQVYEVF
ncbi:short chain dehydrogenase [Parachitinimonas caeni]|uniref:Short chain dehydrogenase n=1 Tax=Parachitinimonas caeni TaxID=3031301 RepID=A0ABT7DV83_9NEIS|nr:short chain dehydrogenase [Parachitinimonas caeni]MDK2123980.1 short chain dehydrogenase [Parachitinimonas caeni]